jgi:hypothetical protein
MVWSHHHAVVMVVAIAVTMSACVRPQCEIQNDLVAGDAWQFVPPAEDTLWPAPDDAELCDDDAIQVQPIGDDLALEIDTRFGCGWATVMQPIAEDVAVGDELQVRIFYFSQTAFPEANAELAIAIGDDVVMRELVPIPASSGLLAPRIVAERDYPRGTPARFHIGNHGDNSWNLVELSRVEVGDCPAETEP